MKTPNYCLKKITLLIFGRKYYQTVKSYKIILDYLLGKDYDDIYKSLSKLLNDESVVFDVGANMGQWLSRLSKIIKHGKIVSIEPVLYNVLALFRMKSLLKIKNAIIISRAISTNIGKAELTIPLLNNIPMGTWATFNNIRDKSLKYDKLEVDTISLDKLFDECNLNTLDFIKVDTEGFDDIVLLSGEKIISKYKPLIRMGQSFFTENCQWLRELGYIPFVIKQNEVLILDQNTSHEGDTYFCDKNMLEKIEHLMSAAI